MFQWRYAYALEQKECVSGMEGAAGKKLTAPVYFFQFTTEDL